MIRFDCVIPFTVFLDINCQLNVHCRLLKSWQTSVNIAQSNKFLRPIAPCALLRALFLIVCPHSLFPALRFSRLLRIDISLCFRLLQLCELFVILLDPYSKHLPSFCRCPSSRRYGASLEVLIPI